MNQRNWKCKFWCDISVLMPCTGVVQQLLWILPLFPLKLKWTVHVQLRWSQRERHKCNTDQPWNEKLSSCFCIYLFILIASLFTVSWKKYAHWFLHLLIYFHSVIILYSKNTYEWKTVLCILWWHAYSPSPVYWVPSMTHRPPYNHRYQQKNACKQSI